MYHYQGCRVARKGLRLLSISKKHMKVTKKDIEKIFGAAIDGASANAYRRVLPALLEVIKATPQPTINAEQMYDVLKKVSNKWEKRIDQYLS